MAMKYPNFHAKQIRSLKYLASSSSTLSRGLQKSFQERFGVSIANLYGCSEIGAAFFDNPREPGWAPGSIGRPFHGYRVVIKDSQRKEVTPGEVGEIGVAGVGVLKGYMNDAQSFAECMHGKYFMTGDLGYQDKAGRYFFVDRVKDIIIKAGINIAPAQIDEVLQSHPNVEESATIGASDHYLGEIVESYVVQKGAGVSALDLIRFCSGVLGSFKTPSKIVFTDALPKGPTGKILKRVLREESSKGLN